MSEIYCESSRVILRKVTLKDVMIITEWKTDPLVKKMALGPDTRISFKTQKQDIKKALNSPNQLYTVIVMKDSGQPIGYIRINWMDTANRYAWLRFALGAQRGKGYTHEALFYLLKKLFSEGMYRVEAEVYEFNQPSLKLLEKLGFRREGLKRQALYDGEKYWDVIVMGLLREDLINY